MSPNSPKMTPNPRRHAKLSEGLDKHLPKAHSWKPYGGELIGPVQARAWQKTSEFKKREKKKTACVGGQEE